MTTNTTYQLNRMMEMEACIDEYLVLSNQSYLSLGYEANEASMKAYTEYNMLMSGVLYFIECEKCISNLYETIEDIHSTAYMYNHFDSKETLVKQMKVLRELKHVVERYYL